MNSREMVLQALLQREEGAVPWIEIETRDELVSAFLGANEVGWHERVRFARSVGQDAVGFAHWERFGCDVIKKGAVLGFNARIKSRADMDKFTMPSKIDFGKLKDTVRRAKDAIADTGLSLFVAHVLCFDPIVMDMGFENFSIALYEDRDFIHEILKRYTGYYGALDDFYSDQPEIDFIWVGEDIAFKSGIFINPDLFRELMLPYFKEITGNIRKPWIYHSDGDIGKVLPDLLALGMNAIHPLEPGAMDIHEVKKQYGDKVTLIGNVDITTLTLGTENDVRNEVFSLMDSVSPGGGYILSSSNSLTNYVKPGNVKAMGDAKMEWNKKKGYC